MAKGVKVVKPSPELLDRLGVDQWSRWSCGKSAFDWSYDDTETCLIQQGRVTIETPEGDVDFGKGDLVQFAPGLSCRWVVHEPVAKVYRFGRQDIDG